jgi:hypothetical protein
VAVDGSHRERFTVQGWAWVGVPAPWGFGVALSVRGAPSRGLSSNRLSEPGQPPTIAAIFGGTINFHQLPTVEPLA